MSAKIEVVLEKLKLPIIGMGKIDIFVDGTIVLSLELGESATTDVSLGKHSVQAALNGVVKRKSNKLEISFEENSTVKILGKYSRVWGNLNLQRS